MNDLYLERNFGGAMLAQLLQPVLKRFFREPGSEDRPEGWACAVDTVHQHVQKEVRIIETLEPVMNQHRLVVDEAVARDETLMGQLTRITKQRGCLPHDDRLDALAGCVAQFKDLLHQDATVQAARRAEEEFEAGLRKLEARFARPAPSWIRRGA